MAESYGKGAVSDYAKVLAEAIAAESERELAQARSEAVEECCRAVCGCCQHKDPVEFSEFTKRWIHKGLIYSDCGADAIRRLSTKGEGKEKTK